VGLQESAKTGANRKGEQANVYLYQQQITMREGRGNNASRQAWAKEKAMRHVCKRRHDLKAAQQQAMQRHH